ncbi:hypothetical protein LC607_29475 [Nostoc sp. CHAB 5824]|nr:hypothetical protein [Nostoc sp. CHAB 5824]
MSATPVPLRESCYVERLEQKGRRSSDKSGKPPGERLRHYLDMLLIASVSLNKPVVRYSLFVMNTDAEII